MKVLYFHQHFTTPQYGGGTRSYEFSKALLAKGHQVTMVCGAAKDFGLPKKSKYIYRGLIDDIDVIQIRVSYSNNQSLYRRTISFAIFAIIGIWIAMREKYDLFFATSTPLTAGIPGIWMKKIMRKKKSFVFEVRDLWPELPKALGLKNKFLLKSMDILESLSYKSADACIGLSPGIVAGIKHKVPEKQVEMIPNGCDTGLFMPNHTKESILPGILPDDIIAVFTGAHGIANGLDAVLDMAKVLKGRDRKDIKLVFVGDGIEKERLIKRAKEESLDNCLFFPPIPKTELIKVMARADIGLMVLKNLPAFYYGTSPNKFFDYISSGLPVINNYPGWLSDLINEHNCGIAVKPDSPEQFADALIDLADSPEKRCAYGLNGRSLAERMFDRNLLSENFVAFLEKINNK